MVRGSLGSSRPRLTRGPRQHAWLRSWRGHPKDWRDLWHWFPAPRVGRREPCQGCSPARPPMLRMEAFLVSTVVVGLAEIGDKTQILSLILAARFQRPVPIVFGILFATLANHAVAGLAGVLFGSVLGG